MEEAKWRQKKTTETLLILLALMYFFFFKFYLYSAFRESLVKIMADVIAVWGFLVLGYFLLRRRDQLQFLLQDEMEVLAFGGFVLDN